VLVVRGFARYIVDVQDTDLTDLGQAREYVERVVSDLL
jgi:hypothetical protein